ncbi:MAG: ribonuclease D [Francisellaceae bacterium]
MIIDNNEALNKLVSQLNTQDAIAVDTEFYWRYSYYPILCLIQIATENDSWLIDATVKELELSKLNVIFANPDICKILHAADNDIRILNHYLGSQFSQVFDTQIAMDFLGSKHQISLKNLLALFDIHDLDKQEKMSDWRRRPLTDNQIAYARADVVHLHKLKSILSQKLKQANNYDHFQNEMTERFINMGYLQAEMGFTRLNVHRYVEGKTRANLIALANWRESQAQKRNMIYRHILTDQEIVRISRLNPDSFSILKKSNILQQKKLTHYGKFIVYLVNNLSIEDNIKRLSRSGNSLINTIYDTLTLMCQQQGITTEQVCSKQELTLFLQSIYHLDRIPDVRLTYGWRYDLFGQKLIEIYEDKLKDFQYG